MRRNKHLACRESYLNHRSPESSGGKGIYLDPANRWFRAVRQANLLYHNYLILQGLLTVYLYQCHLSKWAEKTNTENKVGYAEDHSFSLNKC